jgi:hypothetical protein
VGQGKSGFYDLMLRTMSSKRMNVRQRSGFGKITLSKFNTLQYLKLENYIQLAEIMNQNQSLKEKWISDAAYYKSLGHISTPGLEIRDWLEAEQEYRQLINKRIKLGLVKIDHAYAVDPQD